MNEKDSFEQSYARLEQILEKMNSGQIALDESLKLYEEADTLITSCTKKLNDAEQKIEVLIKQRNGDLTLNENQKPKMEPFAATASSRNMGQ